MIIYIEDKNGALSFESMIIPANTENRHYKQALAEVANGDAAIEAWTGSQRESDYNARKSVADWKESRATSVAAITVEVDGLVFDGDEISQGRMARAVVASSSDDEQTVWVLADNTPATVTASQLRRALKLAGLAQTALWVA